MPGCGTTVRRPYGFAISWPSFGELGGVESIVIDRLEVSPVKGRVIGGPLRPPTATADRPEFRVDPGHPASPSETTAGARHRAFAELSASLIAIGYRDLGFGRYESVRRHYGPGLAAGYHYTAAGGFTVLVAAGAGWAVGPDRIEPILTLGAGHTFPR